jgi:hypothetical protein
MSSIATSRRSATRDWTAGARRWVVSIALGLLVVVVACEAGPLDAQWFPIGPAPEGAGGFGVTGGVSGRVWSIAFSRNFDQHGHAAMYIGTAGGGVWRSTDFSQPLSTWTPLTDHLPGSVPFNSLIGFQNVGAVAVDPNHPWIVYASSGDPAGPGPNSYSGGMLKSTDGGNSWMFQALNRNPFAPGVSRIFVDPTDSSGNTVYATGGFGPNSPLRGLFRSKNGGTTWNPINGNLPSPVAITDLDYLVSGNQLTLLTGVVDTTKANGTINGIYQSTNGGSSWSRMQISPQTDLKNQAVTNASLGLVRLATDRTEGSPHGAYAAVSDSSTANLINIFKLEANGWKPVGSGISGITSAWGALALGVSELGIVYVGMGNASQDGIYQSTDQGAHWSSIFPGSNGNRPHHDQRSWGFFNGQVFEGNDGGLFRFVPLANGKAGPGDWQSLNSPTLDTIMANGIGLHPHYPNVLLVGSQDNGVALRNGGTWNYVTGDDDTHPRFDPFDANFAYRASVSEEAFFFRSNDGGLTWPTQDKSTPGGAQTDAPYVFHPTVAGRLALGSDRVFETFSRGDSWTAISGPRGGPVTALAYGTGDDIYAAFGGALFKTANHGGNGDDNNWTKLNAGVDWLGTLIAIAVDRHNSQRVYVATDTGVVWQSLTGGTTWANITGDLPPKPFRLSALTMRSDTTSVEPTLFVAMSVGVYASPPSPLSGARHWQRLGSLPDTWATDVVYHDTTKYLVASTFGRGVFASYQHFLTNSGLGAASLNNTAFVYARDLDDRVIGNQATFSQAFSGWIELQGGGQTDAAPAATAVNSSVFVFIKGLKGDIQLNQAAFGHPYSGWTEVQGGGVTDAAPSASTISGHVFVFIKGLDKNIYLNQADFGHAFGQWFVVPGQKLTDVAVTTTSIHNSVFVFAKGLDRKIYVNQADFGHAFGQWFEVQGNGLTDTSPSSAAVGNTVFVVIRSPDGRILVNQAGFGHAFSGWTELQGGGQTDAAPVAVGIGNSLFVYMKGLDGRIYLNQAALGHPFSGWFEVGGGLR